MLFLQRTFDAGSSAERVIEMDWEAEYNKMSPEEKQIFDLAVDYGLLDDLKKWEKPKNEGTMEGHKNSN